LHVLACLLHHAAWLQVGWWGGWVQAVYICLLLLNCIMPKHLQLPYHMCVRVGVLGWQAVLFRSRGNDLHLVIFQWLGAGMGLKAWLLSS
jgi:hypothetical protein